MPTVQFDIRPADLLAYPATVLWGAIRARWTEILQASGVRDVRLPKTPKLLTSDQDKLALGESLGWRTVGLQLAPAREALRPDVTGTLCPLAGICALSCVKGMGQNDFAPAADTRAWRTAVILGAPQLGFELLARELESFSRSARKDRFLPAARLNTIADLDWRPFLDAYWRRIGDIRYYDYTKVPSRALREAELSQMGGTGPRWDLVYSVSELSDPAKVTGMVRRGVKVSVVTTRKKGELLARDKRYGGNVVDGDVHDLTFLHPAGTVLDLSFKSRRNLDSQRAAAFAAGFCKA